MKRLGLIILALLLGSSTVFSQNREESDSLIRLLTANKIQLVEVDGDACRKVEGPARFLHNNTYLICDTAIWNVDKDYIDAFGHVQIIQDNTMLTGDRLHYIIERDLAQFRGTLVELKDDKGNALRTEYLDYNTRDSIAFFYHGASMRDSTGNIIESADGTYESKENLFTFVKNVQMFSDSLFFVSDKMRYRSDLETAYFSENTYGWKNRNFFSSNGGWYNRSNETLYFDKEVYGQTKDYELWCDDLFFDRMSNHAILRGDIQITDTVDNAFIFGNHLDFVDEPRRVTITKEPVFVALVEEEAVIDTVFITADTLGFYSLRMFEIDSLTKSAAQERKELAAVDPVSNIRQQKAAQKAAEDAKEEANARGLGKPGAAIGDAAKSAGAAAGDSIPAAAVDTLQSASPPADSTSLAVKDSSVAGDSLMVKGSLMAGDTLMMRDSLMAGDTLMVMDSLTVKDTVEIIDTTEIYFLEAYHHVMIYKSDNQVKCDSLLYSDLDSMARLFSSPVIWNEVKNQLTADSMQIVMENSEMKKGLMLSNAFLASYDSDNYYNQIKAPEMAGFFKDGEISRFDAMGGASMIIYMADSTSVNYANVKECKIISSLLEGGELKKNYYFESITSNIFPIEEMTSDNMFLKDFKWRGEERPVDRYQLTDVRFRPSQRKYTLESPYYPLFDYTSKYFPGYIDGIMEEIRSREEWIWKSSKR